MYKRIISICVLLMGSAYLLSVIFPNRVLLLLINVFAILVVGFYLPILKKSSKLITFSLLGISFVLFAVNNNLKGAFFSFDSNVSILSIFIFVPLLSIPLKAAKYLDYMEILYNLYIKSKQSLYLMTNLVTYGLCVLMNLGAVTLVYQLTDTPAYRDYKDIRYKALVRAYPLAILWSPYYISMAVIISYFNVSWIELFPVGFTIGVIGVFIGVYLESKGEGLLDPIEPKILGESSYVKAWLKVFELVGITVLLTAVIMIFSHWWSVSVIPLISIFSIVLCFVWTLFYEKVSFLFKQLREYVEVKIPNMGNELTLFISAGVFGQAIINIGADDGIVYLLDQIGVDHPIILIFIIIIATSALTFLGIHPIITITVLAVTISSTPVFMDHHRVIAMGMLVSWALSVPISPFSAITLLMAGLTNRNSLEIGLKKNYKFVIYLAVASFLFITIIHFLFNY